MNTTLYFELIDGTFSPKEASQVLGSMLKSKIDYHSLVSHSDSELSGDSKIRFKERFQQLQNLNSKLKELFETAATANRNLKICGRLKIDFVD